MSLGSLDNIGGQPRTCRGRRSSRKIGGFLTRLSACSIAKAANWPSSIMRCREDGREPLAIRCEPGTHDDHAVSIVAFDGALDPKDEEDNCGHLSKPSGLG